MKARKNLQQSTFLATPVLFQEGHVAGFSVDRPTLLRIASEVAAGLAYIHSKDVVHRDIAARNILVAEDFTVKIADLGISRVILRYYMAETRVCMQLLSRRKNK